MDAYIDIFKVVFIVIAWRCGRPLSLHLGRLPLKGEQIL